MTKIFITGSSGWIGSALTRALTKRGHTVIGFARSDESADKSKAAGAAEIIKGSLSDLDALKEGAKRADAIVHCGYVHDFGAGRLAAIETDIAAIKAMASAIEGTDKVFLVTSGTALSMPGQIAIETQATAQRNPHFERGQSEVLVEELAKKGIRVSVVRMPPSVHGTGDKGFVPMISTKTREVGTSMYVDDGSNRWAAVHVNDAAECYVLALEKGLTGATYHAVAEGELKFRDIAQAIGDINKVPVVSKSAQEVQKTFGDFIGAVLGMDVPASSEWTRQTLGWQPREIGLVEDIIKNYKAGQESLQLH